MGENNVAQAYSYGHKCAELTLTIFTSHSLPFYVSEGDNEPFTSGGKANTHLRLAWSSTLVNLDR